MNMKNGTTSTAYEVRCRNAPDASKLSEQLQPLS
jgi:hypothetical protein